MIVSVRKERWRIKVLEITGDRELLVFALRDNGFELDGDRLLSDKFEALDNALAVHTMGVNLCRQINQISKLRSDISMAFRLGSVIEMTPDGERGRHFAAGSVVAPAMIVAGHATTNERSLTHEERAKIEREIQKEKAATILRTVRADGNVLTVMELLEGDPTTHNLWHVKEIIERSMDGNLTALVSNNQLKRFTRSINHPDVLGGNARHAIPKGDPPPNPMYLDELAKFTRGLADRWIAQKSGPS